MYQKQVKTRTFEQNLTLPRSSPLSLFTLYIQRRIKTKRRTIYKMKNARGRGGCESKRVNRARNLQITVATQPAKRGGKTQGESKYRRTTRPRIDCKFSFHRSYSLVSR